MPINRMITMAKCGYLVISGLMAVLGVAMIVAADAPAGLFCSLAGGLLILFGIVKVIGYCSRDLYRLVFQHDLAFGILLPIIGIVLLLHAGEMVHLAFVILGVLILTDSLLKVQIALDARVFGIERWYWIILPAAVTSILGFILLLRLVSGQPASAQLLGTALIAEAVLNSAAILIAVKVIKNRQ